jgi:hypothetical protein
MKPKSLLFAVLISLCLFQPASAFAKSFPGEIRGTVITLSHSEVVPYANVRLFQNGKETLFKGLITDENGQFALSEIPLGEYLLEVSYLGYEKQTQYVQLTNSSSELNLGAIQLKENLTKLEEVTIEEERLKGKQEIDRTVYTINSRVKELSNGGMDVLKHIPGVSVDFQDNVSLEGTSNILYIVNGIKRDKDYVAQLNADDFNKVEIITNPGVEYDADIDAVIQIVLLKLPKGGRGSLSAQIPNPEAIVGNHTGSIEYGTEKYRIFVTDRAHFEKFTALSESSTLIHNLSESSLLVEEGEGIAKWLNNTVNYGVDLFLSENHTLNIFGSYYNHFSNNVDYTQNGKQFSDDVLSDEYTLYMDRISSGRGVYQSAFYRYLFDEKKHEFTSQLNYYNYKANYENDYAYDYFFMDQNEVEIDLFKRYENIENKRNMFEWRNDYSRPLGDWMLKAGYWSYFQKYNNSFDSDSRDLYKFYYQEFRQEAYFNGATTMGDFQLSTGLRYAYSFAKIDKNANNEYMEFLPQVNLQYSINDQSSIKLSARRQIDRPSMAQLNPFVTQTDSLSLSKGNANLKPQIINRTELQYALNYKSNYIAPKLFVDYSQNGIQSNTFINEDGISVTQSQNIGEYYSYGMGLTASVGVSHWLKINGNGRLYRSGVTGPNNYSEELTTWAVNGSLNVSPWKEKKIGFMLSAQYQSERLQYKSRYQRDLLMFVGFEGQVTDQFSVGGYIVPCNFNFTYSASERYDTNYEYSTTNQVEAPYLFAIDLSYKFNWGETPKKIQRSLDYEKDGSGGSL